MLQSYVFSSEASSGTSTKTQLFLLVFIAGIQKSADLCNMISVLAILWGSAVLGYLLRRYRMEWTVPLLMVSVWLLLFVIGLEVGSNPLLRNGLPRFGLQALLCALLCTAGCCLPAAFLWRHTRPEDTGQYTETTDRRAGQPAVSLWGQMRDSLVIVGFFTAGTIIGAGGWLPPVPPETNLYTLYLLLCCVGLHVGRNPHIFSHMRHMDKRLMLLPLVTVGGTWVGAALTSIWLPAHKLSDWLAVGSGFGYYSLSSVLITELRGAELGTIALIYNILRELIVLLGAPLLLRYFGPLAPVSTAGATSGDTTLPVIAGICGKDIVPLSVFHGLTVDFSVPFLVPFFCSLSSQL